MSSNNSKEIVVSENRPANDYSIALTLFEIDKKYQERFSLFLKELQAINSEIDLINKDIKQLRKSIKKDSSDIEFLNSEINAELLYLEKLNNKLSTKINVAIEIKRYSNLENSYKDILEELSEEIRELEIDILEKELQRENLQLKIMPILQKIDELEAKKVELEAKKRYIESLGTSQEKVHQIENRDIIDTQELKD